MFIKQLGNVKDYFLDKFIYNKNPLSALSTATIQELKQKNSRITVSQVAFNLMEKISQEKDANIREEAEKFLAICAKKRTIRPTGQQALKNLDICLHQEKRIFKITSNQTDLKRWEKWGFEKELFTSFNSFAQFLLSTPLGNQLKIFDQTLEVKDGQIGILVEGKWLCSEEIMKQFEVRYCNQHHEKFLIKKDTKEVYTYLNNGQGLQKHHPYEELNLQCPITRLTAEEFERTLTTAKKFVRPGENALNEKRNEGRDFIYQIVSSYVDGGPNTNMTELCYRRKHPYIRVICGRDNEERGTKKGDVFEIGFGWYQSPFWPNTTSKGRFRTEDLWNYNSRVKERVITNIAISAQEANTMFEHISNFHASNQSPQAKDRLAFNLAAQNCSAFVNNSAKSIGLDLPTEINFIGFLQEISPDWMKMTGRAYLKGRAKVLSGLNKATKWVPNMVKSPIVFTAIKTRFFVLVLLNALITPVISLISLALGGLKGEKGRKFTDDSTKKETFHPRLFNRLSYLFNLNRFNYHLPGLLQKWQREQASTIVYQNPCKLVVAAP